MAAGGALAVGARRVLLLGDWLAGGLTDHQPGRRRAALLARVKMDREEASNEGPHDGMPTRWMSFYQCQWRPTCGRNLSVPSSAELRAVGRGRRLLAEAAAGARDGPATPPAARPPAERCCCCLRHGESGKGERHESKNDGGRRALHLRRHDGGGRERGAKRRVGREAFVNKHQQQAGSPAAAAARSKGSADVLARLRSTTAGWAPARQQHPAQWHATTSKIKEGRQPNREVPAGRGG